MAAAPPHVDPVLRPVPPELRPEGSPGGRRKLWMLLATLAFLLALGGLELVGLSPESVGHLGTAGILALGGGMAGNAAEHLSRRPR